MDVCAEMLVFPGFEGLTEVLAGCPQGYPAQIFPFGLIFVPERITVIINTRGYAGGGIRPNMPSDRFAAKVSALCELKDELFALSKASI